MYIVFGYFSNIQIISICIINETQLYLLVLSHNQSFLVLIAINPVLLFPDSRQTLIYESRPLRKSLVLLYLPLVKFYQYKMEQKKGEEQKNMYVM